MGITVCVDLLASSPELDLSHGHGDKYVDTIETDIRLAALPRLDGRAECLPTEYQRFVNYWLTK